MMNTRVSIWQKALRMVLALALAATAVPFVAPDKAHADWVDNTYHITSVADLVYAVNLTHTTAGQSINIVLDNDLTLNEADLEVAKQNGGLIFGTIDLPFKGAFDGRGHTITGLEYNRDLWTPKANTGLFASTDGATIKNLTLKDAKIGADFRGGVLVGRADSTRIENVTLISCTSSITPANNAVSLITNAGVLGGILAGETNGGVIYNCEVRGGRCVSNSTSAVAALGGEGLYMGALVGAASGTVIEYSRVTPIREVAADGAVTYQHASVKNSYDKAVGALGGFTVYAGGVTGQLSNGAQMIDCFSTADCYAYCGTYVSVGAGATVSVGGLTASAYDSNCSIERSHYAGNLSSKQYNALIVIPIIEYNVYLAGLARRADGLSVSESYFKPSASAEEGTNKKIPALNDAATGPSFGPLDDDVYVDRDFWEGCGYDFAGGIERSSAYSASHINKWVIDYDLGIPVHGSSIKATFDFPGAASVSIGTTGLSPTQAQTTDNAWKFAVQGVLAADETVELSATTIDAPMANGTNGYRFAGWYREPKVTVNEVAEDPAYFEPMVTEGKRVSSEPTYAPVNTPDVKQFEDNDLFIAHHQAQVLFHDVSGNVISKETGLVDADTADDWYGYFDSLPSVRPENAPAGATFVGWTTTADPKTGAGYDGITSSDLVAIMNNGALYKAGDPVDKPMDLYPIYINYSVNIITEIEGYSTEANKTVRDGVGSTNVEKAANADGSTSYRVFVKNADGTELSNGGALPDGYRFLGWYKNVDGVEVRVSSDSSYTIPVDTDLTQQQTYIARFEYRVDYYARAYKQDNGNDFATSTLYASLWQRYGTAFDEIPGPAFLYEDIVHWGSDHADHTGQSEAEVGVCSQKYTVDTLIVQPLSAYSHNKFTGSNPTNDQSIKLTMNFPDSGSLSQTGSAASNDFTVVHSPKTGFSFGFWAAERDDSKPNALADKGIWLASDASWNATGGHKPANSYVYEAHVVAQVDFNLLDGGKTSTVREYESAVFQQEKKDLTSYDAAGIKGSKYNVYPYKGSNEIKQSDLKKALGTAADGFCEDVSPTADSMHRDGYRFLGWIDKSAIAAGEMTQQEWDYIFDVKDDQNQYCTSQASKAVPYLLAADAVCTRPMDLYPVYVKYDVTVTTNIAQAGVPSGAGVNIPAAPVIASDASGNFILPYKTYGPDAAGKANVTVKDDQTIDLFLTAEDGKTPVVTDGQVTYLLKSWTIEKTFQGQTHTETIPVGNPAAAGENPLSYTIESGPSYKFIANYEPLVVVYHVNDGVTETVVRNNGQQLGKGPDPTFDIVTIDTANNGIHVFVGWTATRPAVGQYAIWSEGTAMVSSSTIVHRSMELWPVYRAASVDVNSNIDDVIPENERENYRSLSRLGSIDSVTLVAEANDFPGYQFDHWATGYVDDNNQGATVTDNSNFVLRGGKPFENVMYTAVYVPVHEVRYHDTQGDVIYTANVKGDERTFVHEVPVGTEAAPDSGGGTTAGPEGTTPTQQVPIDVEAYHNIAVALDAAANENGREAFSNWQWSDNGAMVPWDQFCNTAITQDMDLYPVTWQVKASDAQGVAMTKQLTWAIDVSALETSSAPTAEGSAAMPNAEKQTYPIQAYFRQGNYYDQKYLTVHVEKRLYEPSGNTVKFTNPNPDPALGKQVALYDDKATGNVLASHVGANGDFQDYQVVSIKGTQVCSVDGTSHATQNDGDALFVFGDIKPLTIVKKTTAKEAAGETFLFTVTNFKDGTPQTRSASVQCSKTPDKDGLYTASVQLQLGQGEYFVREDESWAWRYGQSYQVNGMTVPSGADGARVVVSRSQDGSTVVCENKLENDAWLDDSARAINEFGQGAIL
ncbi:InlB B-repeat-containing protein [Eggerthella lenta]|nr:InlB B-repeat-containing protein [Eggerthella lenta]